MLQKRPVQRQCCRLDGLDPDWQHRVWGSKLLFFVLSFTSSDSPQILEEKPYQENAITVQRGSMARGHMIDAGKKEGREVLQQKKKQQRTRRETHTAHWQRQNFKS